MHTEVHLLLLLLKRIDRILQRFPLFDQQPDPLADLLGHVLNRVLCIRDVQSTTSLIMLIGDSDDFISQVLQSEH